MNTRTATATLLTVLLATVALTACSPSEDTTPTPSPSPAVTQAPVVEETPAPTENPEDEGTGFAAGSTYELAEGATSTEQRGVTLTCEDREGETPAEVTVWWSDPADETNSDYTEVLCSYFSETEW